MKIKVERRGEEGKREGERGEGKRRGRVRRMWEIEEGEYINICRRRMR